MTIKFLTGAILGAILGTILALLLLAADALAAPICTDHRIMAEKLETRFSEVPVNIGLATDGSVIEVFASEAGTFTLVLTRPEGISCVMAAGENWEALPQALAGVRL